MQSRHGIHTCSVNRGGKSMDFSMCEDREGKVCQGRTHGSTNLNPGEALQGGKERGGQEAGSIRANIYGR